MANFTFKWSTTFSGHRHGFSETYYFQQATANLDQAQASVVPIIAKRAALLAAGYTLDTSRVAIVINDVNQSVKRRVELREPNTPGNQEKDPSPPNVALMCRFESNDTQYYKLLFMRGLWATVPDAGLRPVMTPEWLSLFNSWRSSMIFAGMGWLRTEESASATITNYEQDPDFGYVTFTLGGAGLTFPVAVGRLTRVYVNLPGKTPLDGPLVVRVLSATSCVTNTPIGVAPFTNIGTMSLRTNSFVTLAAAGGIPAGEIHPQRVVTRKSGRPTYASRGRAAARSRW